MAADCADGTIINKTVGNIKFDGIPCYIQDTIVENDVEVTNSPSFNMLGSQVGGHITVKGGSDVFLVLTKVNGKGDTVRITDNDSAIVSGNIIKNNLVVKRHLIAVVARNDVGGDLLCGDGGNIEQRTFLNNVGGNDNCPPRPAEIHCT